MEERNLSEKKTNVLLLLSQLCSEAGLQVLDDTDRSDPSIDFVSIKYDDIGISKSEILNQVFFMPTDPAEPGVMNGTVLYIMCDSIDSKSEIAMKYAINFVNSKLPIGAFYLDPTNTVLSYRQTFTVLETDSDEQVIEQFSLHMNIGLEYVQMWLDAFIGLNAGLYTLEEFFQLKD